MDVIDEIKDKIKKINEKAIFVSKGLESNDPAKKRRARETLDSLNIQLSNAGSILFWIDEKRI